MLKFGLRSYGGFKLSGTGFPRIFSAPSGETMHWTPKSFRGARSCSRFSITVISLVGFGFHPPPWRLKTLSFLLLTALPAAQSADFYSAPQCSHWKRCTSYGDSVCLSVRLSYAGIVSKRQHVARCSLHCQIAKCV